MGLFDEAESEGLIPDFQGSPEIGGPDNPASLFAPDLPAQTPTENDGTTLGGIAGGFASGVFGIGESVGGLASLVGADTIGQGITDFFRGLQEEFAPEDPTFVEKLAAGIGSGVTFMLPGLGVAKGVQVIKALPKLKKYANQIGASTSAVLEASAEAGSIFNTNIQLGKSEEEARALAATSLAPNLVLTTFTNIAGGVFSGFRGPIGKGVSGFAAEAVQEAGQEVVGSLFTTGEVEPSQVGEAALIGGLVGGLFGGVRGAIDPRSEEEIEAAEKALDEAREAGEGAKAEFRPEIQSPQKPEDIQGKVFNHFTPPESAEEITKGGLFELDRPDETGDFMFRVVDGAIYLSLDDVGWSTGITINRERASKEELERHINEAKESSFDVGAVVPLRVSKDARVLIANDSVAFADEFLDTAKSIGLGLRDLQGSRSNPGVVYSDPRVWAELAKKYDVVSFGNVSEGEQVGGGKPGRPPSTFFTQLHGNQLLVLNPKVLNFLDGRQLAARKGPAPKPEAVKAAEERELLHKNFEFQGEKFQQFDEVKVDDLDAGEEFTGTIDEFIRLKDTDTVIATIREDDGTEHHYNLDVDSVSFELIPPDAPKAGFKRVESFTTREQGSDTETEARFEDTVLFTHPETGADRIGVVVDIRENEEGDLQIDIESREDAEAQTETITVTDEDFAPLLATQTEEEFFDAQVQATIVRQARRKLERGEVITPEEARALDREAQEGGLFGGLQRQPGKRPTLKDFEAVGKAQREAPEEAMVRAQHRMGGGVGGFALEHGGDIIHRMSEFAQDGNTGKGAVAEKVKKVLDTLVHRYGFLREHGENMESNARFTAREKGTDPAQYEARWKEAVTSYINEHKKLRPLNEAQRAANRIAIAIGEGVRDFNQSRIDDAVKDLRLLESKLEDADTWAAFVHEGIGEPTVAAEKHEAEVERAIRQQVLKEAIKARLAKGEKEKPFKLKFRRAKAGSSPPFGEVKSQLRKTPSMKVVMVSPQDFFSAMYEGQFVGLPSRELNRSPEAFFRIAQWGLHGRKGEEGTIDRILRRLAKNRPIDMPFLEIDLTNGVQWSHQGRHRMVAAWLAGVEKVPVQLVFSENTESGRDEVDVRKMKLADIRARLRGAAKRLIPGKDAPPLQFDFDIAQDIGRVAGLIRDQIGAAEALPSRNATEEWLKTQALARAREATVEEAGLDPNEIRLLRQKRKKGEEALARGEGLPREFRMTQAEQDKLDLADQLGIGVFAGVQRPGRERQRKAQRPERQRRKAQPKPTARQITPQEVPIRTPAAELRDKKIAQLFERMSKNEEALLAAQKAEQTATTPEAKAKAANDIRKIRKARKEMGDEVGRLLGITDVEVTRDPLKLLSKPTVRGGFSLGRKLAYITAGRLQAAMRAEAALRLKSAKDFTRKQRRELKKLADEKAARLEGLRAAMEQFILEELPGREFRAERGDSIRSIRRARTDKALLREMGTIRARADKARRKNSIKIIKNQVNIAKTSRAVLAEGKKFVLDEMDKAGDLNKLSLGELQVLESRLLQAIYMGKQRLNEIKAKQKLAAGQLADEVTEQAPSNVVDDFAGMLPGVDMRNPSSFKSTLAKFWGGIKRINLSLTPYDFIFDYLGNAAQRIYRYVMHQKGLANAEFERLVGPIFDILQTAEFREEQFTHISIHAALQQKGGKKKLIAQGVDEKLIKAAEEDRLLTTKDKELYHAMRKVLDELYPRVSEAMAKNFQIVLREIENYFPFMVDFRALEHHQSIKGEHERMELLHESFVPGTVTPKNQHAQRPGFSNERTGGKGPTVRLHALHVFLKYVRTATYIKHMADPIRDARAAFGSAQFKQKVGKTMSGITDDFIELLVNQGRMGDDIASETLKMWRGNFGIAMLGGNLMTAFVQPFAIIDGGAETGVSALRDAIRHMVDVKWRSDFIDSISGQIKQDTGDDPVYIEALEAIRETEVGKAGKAEIRRLALNMLKAGDGWARRSVFLASLSNELKSKYNVDLFSLKPETARDEIISAIAEAGPTGKKGDATKVFSRQKAERAFGVLVNNAEALVRRTQGSPEALAQSPVVATGRFGADRILNTDAAKLVFQFKNFILRRYAWIRYNMLPESATAEEAKRIWPLVMWMMMAYGAESFLRQVPSEIIEAMTGEDDDERDFASAWLSRSLMEMAGTVPLVGDALYTSKFGGTGPVPFLSVFKRGGDFLLTAAEVPSGEPTVRQTLNAVVSGGESVGMLMGIPFTRQVGKTTKAAIRYGTSTPPGDRVPASEAALFPKGDPLKALYKSMESNEETNREKRLERGNPKLKDFFAGG